MKKNTVIFFTLFVIAQLLVVSSCKKKEVLETPFTRMLGVWQKTEYATDDNGNGIIDPGEIHYVESGVKDLLTFNSDSTGVEVDNSAPPLLFQWAILDGPSVILYYHANDTIAYYISEVTSGDLTLTTNTSLGLAWYYYVKK